MNSMMLVVFQQNLKSRCQLGRHAVSNVQLGASHALLQPTICKSEDAGIDDTMDGTKPFEYLEKEDIDKFDRDGSDSFPDTPGNPLEYKLVTYAFEGSCRRR